MKTRNIVIGLVLGVLVISITLALLFVSVCSAGEWQYKTESTLDDVPSGGYVYNLTVHGGSGTNNQTDVFLNGHNATNFADIRFILDDTIELAYWIEDNSTDPIKVWANVTDNGTVGLHYGNSHVSDASDGDATFIMFDDFDNLNAWTQQSGIWTANGTMFSSNKGSGVHDVLKYTSPLCINDSYAVFTKVYEKEATGAAERIPLACNAPSSVPTDWTDTYYVPMLDYADNQIYADSIAGGFTSQTINLDTWYLFEWIYHSSGTNTTKTRVYHASNRTYINQHKINGNNDHNDSYFAFKGTYSYYEVDWVFVRKHNITEPLWSTWSIQEYLYEPVDVDSLLQYTTQRKLARTSEGYLHRVCTKFDGTNYRIYYAKSTDEGSTWTETVLTDAGVNNTHPAIASDSEDNMWVVYEREDSGIRYRKYEGLSWQTEQTISMDSGEVPIIAADSSDNVHSVWMTNLSSTYQIRYWNGTSTSNITIGSEDSKYPSLAVDTNDYLHVVYQQWNSTNGSYNIKHQKYTDSWQPVYNITSGETYNQTYPCIATDLSGNAHIVWQTESFQIKSIKYEAAGTWEAIKTVHDGGVYEQANPSISVYSDNYVYATWFGQTATYDENYIIRESHKTTGSWSAASDILYPSGKDVIYPNLVSALYPKICSDCYTDIPDAGYAFVYDEDDTVKYHESGDLAWRCPTKYVLTIKVIDTKTGADVTDFSADIGTGETKTTTNGIIKFRCLDTGYYSLKVVATEYYTYIDNIVIDATKEITIPLTAITEADYFLPKAKPVTFTVQNAWGTTKFEGVHVEAAGYNITHPGGWLGDIFGFTNETEIYNTTQSGTTDSEGQIAFVMVDTIKYKLTFVKEDMGINQTWFKYPTRDEYTIVIWGWEYPDDGTEEMLETTLNITTSTINDTHALIHVNYTDPSDLTSSININITRLTSFNHEEVVWDYTVTNQSVVNESFVVTPYQGRSFDIAITALHEEWGEKIWEYGIKFKGLLSDLELPEKIYPIIAIALIFFIGGFFGASTALQGSLVVSIVGWILYGIGWLSLGSDAVMISALSLATVMSVLGLLMDRGRKAGVQ